MSDPAPTGTPESTYPCDDCGTTLYKAKGGTVFTVCETCWDKHRVSHTHPDSSPVEPQEDDARFFLGLAQMIEDGIPISSPSIARRLREMAATPRVPQEPDGHCIGSTSYGDGDLLVVRPRAGLMAPQPLGTLVYLRAAPAPPEAAVLNAAAGLLEDDVTKLLSEDRPADAHPRAAVAAALRALYATQE